MIISLLTLFPDMYRDFCGTSLVKRAVDKGIITFDLKGLTSFCAPKERVDAPTFGHQAGMVIRAEVIERAITEQERSHKRGVKVFFSPRGKRLDQRLIKDIYEQIEIYNDHLIMCAARYEGIDTRAEEEYADYLVSLGDFVLMGGDLPAQMLLEALLRYVPGVIGSKESVDYDSFSGPFVDCPAYAAPTVWKGREVPPVVRSGDHGKIQEWALQEGSRNAVMSHFSWVRSHALNEQDRKRVEQHLPPHYLVLMHAGILLPQGRVGTTSVTSLDLHDIARSAKTYGMKQFFIVTPLLDQQKIVRTLLHFWKEGYGQQYNPDRCAALQTTVLAESLDEVIATITAQEGSAPLLIVTSAGEIPSLPALTYQDQEKVWKHKKPVLIILGTGRGLAPVITDRADYALVPLKGYSSFNHLSVRSAAAIICDRWLGEQPCVSEKKTILRV